MHGDVSRLEQFLQVTVGLHCFHLLMLLALVDVSFALGLYYFWRGCFLCIFFMIELPSPSSVNSIAYDSTSL